ncbi:hypothetical protein LEP1GSC040_3624 [Leptospira santarosai str. 2000030832]|nr:hypothetical protein LEP1GSC040_3624 [Leptospira santarosai str. 2000030832]
MLNPLEQHTLWRIGSWDSAFAQIALRSPDEANEINTILLSIVWKWRWISATVSNDI